MNKASDFKPAQLLIQNQPYTELYSPADALKNGTVFPNLHQPYILTFQ